MTVTLPTPLPDSIDPPEDGVIKDARERQRRHRRRGGALLAGGAAITALVIGLLGGGGGSGTSMRGQDYASSGQASTQRSQRGSADVAAVPAVAQFGLLAAGVGWVSDGSGVYVTRTGGRTWTPVKAVGPDALVSGFSSGDATQLTLSLAVGAQSSSCSGGACQATTMAAGTSPSQQGEVVSTVNAGLTWASRPFPGRAVPAALSFYGQRSGFALGYAPGAHHDPRANLYGTDDSGRTWSRIASVPFQGLISFANARDGLGGGFDMGAGLVDSGAIYRTVDGGHTWSRTSLCLPATVYSCQAPRLFASGRGVVLVTARYQPTGSTQVQIYTTRNDGASWSRHTLPDTPSITDSPAYIPFSAPNAQHLFVWVSPYLYTSNDGGADWTRRHEPNLTIPGVSPELSHITFINIHYGWLAAGPLFDYTTDGGTHWTEMASRR